MPEVARGLVAGGDEHLCALVATATAVAAPNELALDAVRGDPSDRPSRDAEASLVDDPTFFRAYRRAPGPQAPRFVPATNGAGCAGSTAAGRSTTPSGLAGRSACAGWHPPDRPRRGAVP